MIWKRSKGTFNRPELARENFRMEVTPSWILKDELELSDTKDGIISLFFNTFSLLLTTQFERKTCFQGKKIRC